MVEKEEEKIGKGGGWSWKVTPDFPLLALVSSSSLHFAFSLFPQYFNFSCHRFFLPRTLAIQLINLTRFAASLLLAFVHGSFPPLFYFFFPLLLFFFSFPFSHFHFHFLTFPLFQVARAMHPSMMPSAACSRTHSISLVRRPPTTSVSQVKNPASFLIPFGQLLTVEDKVAPPRARSAPAKATRRSFTISGSGSPRVSFAPSASSSWFFFLKKKTESEGVGERARGKEGMR